MEALNNKLEMVQIRSDVVQLGSIKTTEIWNRFLRRSQTNWTSLTQTNEKVWERNLDSQPRLWRHNDQGILKLGKPVRMTVFWSWIQNLLMTIGIFALGWVA